jgi:hypothetical protein
MAELFKEIANGDVGRTIRRIHHAERIEGMRPEEGIRGEGLDNAAGSSIDEAEIIQTDIVEVKQCLVEELEGKPLQLADWSGSAP